VLPRKGNLTSKAERNCASQIVCYPTTIVQCPSVLLILFQSFSFISVHARAILCATLESFLQPFSRIVRPACRDSQVLANPLDLPSLRR
jgi:hypothetical protein